jgi:SAM-dependent methyltransferase
VAADADVTTGSYVHGYREEEAVRLHHQADTLAALLHHDTAYLPAMRVLEVGCGVGAQTVTLAAHSPGAHITSLDLAAASVTEARRRVAAAGSSNVAFARADIFALPFAAGTFDHVFVCFVLEHLDRPLAALRRLGELLRPGGTLTVIEGDHGSTVLHPDDAKARAAIDCLIELQGRAGGDACIGRRLYPLLVEAGYEEVVVDPRLVYVDGGHPALVEGFIKKTFTAMVAGVRIDAIAAGLTDAGTFDAGIRGLLRTAESDGTFGYTFFKAVGVRR